MTNFHHFTTIVPVNIPEQLEKLETWHKAHGRPIHTLNHSREFEAIRGQVPEWIVPVERRFPQCYGRDYLPFTELLAAIRMLVPEQEDRILLVNSDISIEKPDALALLDDPQTDLFFASRLDVTAQGEVRGRYKYGYDVLSLKRASARILDMPEFYMGIPWWDYILPLSAIMDGYRVKRLDLDAFHHVLHPQRWSPVAFDYIGWRCMKRLLPEEMTAGAASHDRVQKFSEVTNQFLNSRLTADAPLSPEDSQAEFLRRVAAEPRIRKPGMARAAPARTKPVADQKSTGRQSLRAAAPRAAAFQNLIDQITALKTATRHSVRAAHLDIGPDLWLSCDPRGKAEMTCAPQKTALELTVSKGNSGDWAALGMRLDTAAMRGWKYLGLLVQAQADAASGFTPTLRYYPTDAPLADVPVPEPVVLLQEPHTRLAYIPLDQDLLNRSPSGELNLFFHADETRLQLFKLEPLLIG